MAARLDQLRIVLEQRERAERERQLVVAELQREANAIESRIGASHEALMAIRHELRDVLTPRSGAVPMTDLRHQAGATLHGQLRVQAMAIELAGVRSRLQKARESLMQAAAARKAVALLIERRENEAKRAAERRESAELDEISTARAGRADASRQETFS